MTYERPPVGLEYKTATLATGGRPRAHEPSDLVVETVVSLTGAEIGGGVEFAPVPWAARSAAAP